MIPGTNFSNTVPMPATVLGQPTMSAGVRSTQSLPTASLVKNLEDDSWTDTHIWYDTKARPIGSFTKNHLGGSTVTEKQLDFSGAVLAANTFHQRLSSDAQVAVRERFEYDSQFRLLKQYHQVNTNPEVLMAEYAYNELGQVANKKVGNNLQQIDYAYNIRGWVTKVNDPTEINDERFAYELKYTNPVEVSPRFNGNIAEIDWAKSNGVTEPVLRRYSYGYDSHDRLAEAVFSEPNSTLPLNNYYNEMISYDWNGNIEGMVRHAPSQYNNYYETIDDLEYNYDGNQLISVNDGSGNPTGYEGGGSTIGYDANGNMVTMPDRLIDTIEYNLLNLPNKLSIEGNNKNMAYLYRADGSKLKKTFTFRSESDAIYSSSTEYIDGFHYVSSTADDLFSEWQEAGGDAYEPEAFINFIHTGNFINSLKFFPTSEGFYDYEHNEYIYQYKDHLGNVRLSYKRTPGGDLAVVDSNDYYPFGMSFVRNEEENSVFGTGSLYNYKYNGKELQETGMYDYGWRQYMPDIGRWNGMDQLSEKYNSASPYNYVLNNPISFIDPDGRDIKPTDDGWSFTGTDMKLLTKYLRGGNSVTAMSSSLAASALQDNYENSGINSFWSTFSSGSSHGGGGWGTVSVQGGHAVVTTGSPILGNSTGNAGTYSGKYFTMESHFIKIDYAAEARARLATAIKNSPAAQSIGELENFLFIQVPLTVTGVGVYTTVGRVGGSFLGQSFGNYLQGAIQRGVIDFSTQSIFNSGEINYPQVGINSLVGVGGNNYSLITRVAGANVTLNTLNNVWTSFKAGGMPQVRQDSYLNASKIVTGILGASIGAVGGDVIGSAYGNGMDAYLNTHLK